MTREEAIGWLNQIKRSYIFGGDEGFDARRKEAIDMAIEALNIVMDSENDAVESKNDVIKRQDAIKTECRTRCGDTGVMRQEMELDKLEKFLQQNGYKYERIERQGGIGEDRHQIRVFDEENGKELFDVICQRGSYGYEEGLLEAMGSIVNEKEIGDRVEGYLTADEIIRRIKE